MTNVSSAKVVLIHEHPELFKKFKAAAQRQKWLDVAVIFCDEVVELITYEDAERVTSDHTGIRAITHFTYDEAGLTSLNNMLDAVAQELKKKWAPTYARLNDSNSENWSIDMSQKDYVILVYGEYVSSVHRYKLTWSFRGVKSAAEFIARESTPDLEDEAVIDEDEEY